MKRREGARNRDTKTRGEVIAILTESAIQSVCSDLSLNPKGEVVLCCESPGKSVLSFPPWQAYFAFIAGEKGGYGTDFTTP